MASQGSPEPIDFDFFAEEDEDEREGEGERAGGGGGAGERQLRPAAKGHRPESAGSGRSSISVKIPSAGPTSQSARKYSEEEDEEEGERVERKGHRDHSQRESRPRQTNVRLDLKSRGDDDGYSDDDDDDRASSDDEDDDRSSQRRTVARSRPKTCKPRAGLGRQRPDSGSTCSSLRSNPQSQSSSSSRLSPRSREEHSNGDAYSYTSPDESDSDVTDVSPLASPARSPTPTLQYDQDAFEAESLGRGGVGGGGRRHARSKSQPAGERRRSGKKESVRFAGVGVASGGASGGASARSQRERCLEETEARELSRLLRAVLDLEDTPSRAHYQSAGKPRARSSTAAASARKPRSAPPAGAAAHRTMPHQRVNLSFSNDKVRQIDRENQRLLQQILSRPQSGPGIRGSAAGSRTGSRVGPPVRRGRNDPPKLVSHSAICRQREQRKIEMENMKILARIEAANSSSTMQRNKLLQEHSTKHQKYASQVSKGTARPTSSRMSGYACPSSLGKASSMGSLNSVASRSSSGSSRGRRARPVSGPSSMAPPPSGPRQAWDDRW